MTAPAKRRNRAKPASPPRVNIRIVREVQGLSVADLALRINEHGFPLTNDNTIRNVELAHQYGSRPLMVAWAKALGIQPADVILPNGNGGE